MCTNACMYVCVLMYVCMCTNVRTYVCVLMYVCMCTNVRTYVCVLMYVHTYVCTYVGEHALFRGARLRKGVYIILSTTVISGAY